jgi:hypothetical protein
MRTLIGPMIYPDGTPMATARIYLRAARVNWSEAGLVAHSVEQIIITNDAGQFAVAVAYGDYHVWLELPESNGKQNIGRIVVEAGAPIELGELIELSRDASADWSISADWATQDWVNAQILLGGVPYDISIIALNPGTGTAGQLYRVAAAGTLLEPFTFQLKDYVTGNGVSGGLLYEKSDGKPGTLPARRKITGDTLAARGDEIEIDMNAAAGDIDITLPAGFALGDRPVTLYIISDTYLLPYTINVLRNGAQTIEGIADDLEIKRRRSMVLRGVGGNDVRFT